MPDLKVKIKVVLTETALWNEVSKINIWTGCNTVDTVWTCVSLWVHGGAYEGTNKDKCARKYLAPIRQSADTQTEQNGDEESV